MKVTVAIPVYNGARFIDDCLKVISDQTYRDYEVVAVVDSKTTDDSVARLEAHQGEFDSLRIIIQEDSDRLAGARNIGIREARGDAIWFLDVDDYAYPTFLEDLVRVMEEQDADVVFCNHFQQCEKTVPEIPDREYTVTCYPDHSGVGRFTELPVYSWSRLQRMSVFDDGCAMFIHRPSAEDVEQTVRTLISAEKVCFYDKPLYVYYKVGDSASSNHRSQEAESMEATARSLLPLVKERVPEQYGEFRVHMMERLMRQMAFVPYKVYSKVRKESVARQVLKELDHRTMEMRVFGLSGLIYYAVLYPFTHRIWDGKEGLWKE